MDILNVATNGGGTLSLSDEERRHIESMVQVVDVFAELDKDMPLQMVRAFLLVVLHEGKGPNELARKAGLESGVMSRHLSDLGEINRYKQPGHMVVDQRTDIMDRRYRKMFLTRKGAGVLHRLLSVWR
jgi:DNA-binding MarR family transcriptional regulator